MFSAIYVRVYVYVYVYGVVLLRHKRLTTESSWSLQTLKRTDDLYRYLPLSDTVHCVNMRILWPTRKRAVRLTTAILNPTRNGKEPVESSEAHKFRVIHRMTPERNAYLNIRSRARVCH